MMNKYKFLDLLNQKGYSQRSFANKFGYNYKSLNNMINGKVKVGTDDALKMCKDLEIEDLLLRAEIFLN